MGNNDLMVGLEIGTSKICVVVGESRPDGTTKILGVGQAPSRGVRKGEIVDFETAMKCVHEAVVDAEKDGHGEEAGPSEGADWDVLKANAADKGAHHEIAKEQFFHDRHDQRRSDDADPARHLTIRQVVVPCASSLPLAIAMSLPSAVATVPPRCTTTPSQRTRPVSVKPEWRMRRGKGGLALDSALLFFVEMFFQRHLDFFPANAAGWILSHSVHAAI